MSVSGAIDVPSETVTIQGNEYPIDEIAVIEQGETIETHVTASEDYYLILYNTDEDQETHAHMDADESVVVMGDSDDDFDTTDLEPGTYMLSLEPDGRQAVTPVVVQGYDIDLEYPAAAERDAEIELEATVEPTTGLDQPDSVEVGIWDGNDATDVTLTHDGGTSYSTTLSLEQFETGDYDVYATVLDDESAQGYQTSLAVEDGSQLRVMEADNDETDETSDDELADEGDEDSGDENEADSDVNGETEDDSDANGEGEDEDDSSDEGDHDFDASEQDDATNESASSDDENVIDPNETDDVDDSNGDSAADDGLGTASLLTGVVALLIALAVMGRRADS